MADVMPYNAKHPKAAALVRAGLMQAGPEVREPEKAKEPDKK